MKASIVDNKKISNLVEQLHQLYPLSDTKFKRVRKLLTETNKFEILLTQKDAYKGVPDHFSSSLSDIGEIELPTDKILTKEQFNIVSKYWPISFHLNKYIESLLEQQQLQLTNEAGKWIGGLEEKVKDMERMAEY